MAVTLSTLRGSPGAPLRAATQASKAARAEAVAAAGPLERGSRVGREAAAVLPRGVAVTETVERRHWGLGELRQLPGVASTKGRGACPPMPPSATLGKPVRGLQAPAPGPLPLLPPAAATVKCTVLRAGMCPPQSSALSSARAGQLVATSASARAAAAAAGLRAASLPLPLAPPLHPPCQATRLPALSTPQGMRTPRCLSATWATMRGTMGSLALPLPPSSLSPHTTACTTLPSPNLRSWDSLGPHRPLQAAQAAASSGAGPLSTMRRGADTCWAAAAAAAAAAEGPAPSTAPGRAAAALGCGKLSATQRPVGWGGLWLSSQARGSGSGCTGLPLLLPLLLPPSCWYTRNTLGSLAMRSLRAAVRVRLACSTQAAGQVGWSAMAAAQGALMRVAGVGAGAGLLPAPLPRFLPALASSPPAALPAPAAAAAAAAAAALGKSGRVATGQGGRGMPQILS